GQDEITEGGEIFGDPDRQRTVEIREHDLVQNEKIEVGLCRPSIIGGGRRDRDGADLAVRRHADIRNVGTNAPQCLEPFDFSVQSSKKRFRRFRIIAANEEDSALSNRLLHGQTVIWGFWILEIITAQPQKKRL